METKQQDIGGSHVRTRWKLWDLAGESALWTLDFGGSGQQGLSALPIVMRIF